MDIWKWIQYDYLLETCDFPESITYQFVEYFGIGAFSSVCGLLIGVVVEQYRLKNNKLGRDRYGSTTPIYSLDGNKILYTGLEGAVLFVSYQAFFEITKILLPRDFGSPLLFDAIIESVEKSLEG